MQTDNSTLMRAATRGDAAKLCAMIAAFNAEDGHPLRADVSSALCALIADPALGAAFVIEQGASIAGYAILCHGFSLEYGGRDTILDEIYLLPEFRGRGIGAAVLRDLYRWASAEGLRAIHLEVMADNPAMRLYHRQGFVDRGSRFMSRRLD